MRSALLALVTLTFLMPPLESFAAEQYWVTSETLNRRTCPREDCGVVGKFYFREAADVEETRDGWARVTKYYDASCNNGKSDYVDSGNSRCVERNGIKGGESAEWVSFKHLSKTRPADPAAGAAGIAALIRGSDDFGRHRDAFVRATQSLLANGTCSEAYFEEMGGWWRSTNHASKPIYSTYCGGMTQANRIPHIWVDQMMAEEHRLLPSNRRDAGRSALIVGSSAIVGSLIPIIPFVFLPVQPSMFLSIGLAAISLFAVGAYKARVTVGRPGRSGLEMAVIGILSALVGYVVGLLFRAPPTP